MMASRTICRARPMSVLPRRSQRSQSKMSLRSQRALRFYLIRLRYQTLQALVRIIGAFGLHENAFANSSMFDVGPFTRYLFDECGLVAAFRRSASGRAV